jgi:hypothetical protein
MNPTQAVSSFHVPVMVKYWSRLCDIRPGMSPASSPLLLSSMLGRRCCSSRFPSKNDSSPVPCFERRRRRHVMSAINQSDKIAQANMLHTEVEPVLCLSYDYGGFDKAEIETGQSPQRRSRSNKVIQTLNRSSTRPYPIPTRNSSPVVTLSTTTSAKHGSCGSGIGGGRYVFLCCVSQSCGLRCLDFC